MTLMEAVLWLQQRQATVTFVGPNEVLVYVNAVEYRGPDLRGAACEAREGQEGRKL